MNSQFPTIRTRFLATLSFIVISVPVFAQEARLVVPNSANDKPVDWNIVHTFGLDLGNGKSRITVRENDSRGFQNEVDSFVQDLRAYLHEQAATLKDRDTRVVQIVVDQTTHVSENDKENFKKVADEFGLTIRFYHIYVDYEKRARELEADAKKAIEESISDLDARRAALLELPDIKQNWFGKNPKSVDDVHAGEGKWLASRFKELIVKTIRRPVQFWKEIYYKPSRLELKTGTIKGVTTLGLTLSSWFGMGLRPDTICFYLLSGKAVAQETFWGPFVGTWMNFVNLKLTKWGGKLPIRHGPEVFVSLWGHLQGFGLFALDKLLLHGAMPDKVTGPLDPVFLASYWTMGSIGGALGGLFPIGVYKLQTKGYISQHITAVINHFSDMLIPIEGALLGFGSNWLPMVFMVHMGLKVGTYAMATALPARGMITLFPKSMNQETLKKVANFNSLPMAEHFTSKENIREFLRDPQVTREVKEAVIRNVQKIVAGKQKRGEALDTFQLRILDNVIGAYIEWLKEIDFGKIVETKLQEPAQPARSARYSEMSMWGRWWARRQARQERRELAEELSFLNRIINTLGTIPSGTNAALELAASEGKFRHRITLFLGPRFRCQAILKRAGLRGQHTETHALSPTVVE